ncbi:hypothetical protein GJ744_008486 [Endocarpon pusillum]|uniref:Yeast cell wall synthesis Kre9/Knh1-like N-terminal domain-containing protein n=1 Tax=Endocarpon pusillum TaxID=364733 RepID=A0A8H7E556_9EURO|nr:hypothetical protein GJ744_008486 [Endocarpon pusillum]
MRFIATLATGAACLATAVAQVPIAFTSVPVPAIVGQPANITWAGGDGVTPVTITLRKGDPQNLQTISTLTSNGVNGYFLWTPDASLATASDYALQITQGQSDINYSGPFALIGGTGSSSISYSGTSTLPPASVNATITSVTTGASIGTEAPRLALTDVETRMNMGGLFKDHTSSELLPNGVPKMHSSPVLSTGLISPPPASPSPEPATWSSAVGHASTGKSGRVIERLQGEIDRLNRDLQLLKARLDDSEKARETLITHNSYLQDRNSNYEQSQEANLRQTQRKDRMIDELRENLLREKLRVAAAEQTAKEATANEEQWRLEASQSRSLAVQKETEYSTIATCRNLENERHQGSLQRLQDSFQALLRERTEDQGSYARLQVIAEQQNQTIAQLEELNSKTNTNFKAYRSEVDEAIANLRRHVSANDGNVVAKLEEMTRVTDQMKWVMAVDCNVRCPNPTASKEAPI